MAETWWNKLGFKPGTPEDTQNLEAVRRSPLGDAIHLLNPFRDPNAPLPSRAGGLAPPVGGLTPAQLTLAPSHSAGGLTPAQLTLAPSHSAGIRAKFDSSQPQSFRVQLGDGGVYEAGLQPGQRKFTYPDATPDGGVGIALGRTGPEGSSNQVGAPSRQVDLRPQQSGLRLTGNLIQARTGSDYDTPASSGLQPPQYLGPESGLGWKTRLGIYKEQMDAYNKQAGNKTVLDVNAMQEAGAGGRAQLIAKGVNDRNQIDAMVGAANVAESQARGLNAQQLNALANTIGTAVPGTPKYEQALRQGLVLSGQGHSLVKTPKDPRVEKVEIESIGKDGITKTQELRQLNPDGTYTVMKPAAVPLTTDQQRAIKQTEPAFMQAFGNDPSIVAAYNALSPEMRLAQLQKFAASKK